MKTLYIDCSMGAAGDMLTAALLELLPDPDGYVKKLNDLNIPGVKIVREATEKCGITATHMKVLIDGVEEHEGMHEHHDHVHHEHHEHHHASMQDIQDIINSLDIPQKVKYDASTIYALIADAESRVHGKPIEQIHFHEVGSMDAVADVVSVCCLMNEIEPAEVVVSPIHVGSGTVKCAHGTLPVPAPATAELLREFPIYSGDIKGELCTPTGAAIIKYYSTRIGEMPVMTVKGIGYGAGTKDFDTANIVRLILGETESKTDQGTDVVTELSCNVDDMTGEEIGFALERLAEEGALDVYTIPIGMKKSRPGTMICVICRELDSKRMAELIFKYTSTLGIRENITKRYVLDRGNDIEKTPYGNIIKKVSSGYGVTREKYEYDDIARIAKERGISFREVKNELT